MQDECWICFEEGHPQDPVVSVCGCSSRKCHKRCSARWQIENIGRDEEKRCRFCRQLLSPWSNALTTSHTHDTSVEDKDEAPPAVMAIVFEGQVYTIPVRSGPDGEAEFKAAVKTLLGFAHDEDFDVTFQVPVPKLPDVAPPPTPSQHDSSLLLHGLQQYNSAASCAQASAAARARQHAD